VHFATLNKTNFQTSLRKIEAKRLNQKIDFLQNIPCFQSQSRKATHRYTNYLKPTKFTRGMTVYSQGDPTNHIYIVYKGEFE
jgi:CRP-like cAMP-binding protein